LVRKGRRGKLPICWEVAAEESRLKMLLYACGGLACAWDGGWTIREGIRVDRRRGWDSDVPASFRCAEVVRREVVVMSRRGDEVDGGVVVT
jgi:hypothetical protein